MEMMRGQEHAENRDDVRLLLRAEPLERAEQICRRMVARVLLTEGALELEVDPAWTAAIKKVLVKKGVRINELRCVEGSLSTTLPPAA
jgi:hypothetical protein